MTESVCTCFKGQPKIKATNTHRSDEKNETNTGSNVSSPKQFQIPVNEIKCSFPCCMLMFDFKHFIDFTSINV